MKNVQDSKCPENKINKMTSLGKLGGGSVFETSDNSIMLKLRNPEIPILAKLSDYPVWAADIGNGNIKKLESNEIVKYVGDCYNIITTIAYNPRINQKPGSPCK